MVSAPAPQPLALVLEGVRARKSPGVYYEIYDQSAGNAGRQHRGLLCRLD